MLRNKVDNGNYFDSLVYDAACLVVKIKCDNCLVANSTLCIHVLAFPLADVGDATVEFVFSKSSLYS